MAAIFRGGRLTVVKPQEDDLGPVVIKAPRSKVRINTQPAPSKQPDRVKDRQEQEA